MIPYGRQQILPEDIKQVVDVLTSDFITQGPKVPAFEKAIANYCQATYAFAVNSATSALHIATLALDIKSGDIVWTSPISFVASANCALYCGASVDFVDINRKTVNICPKELQNKLILAKKNKQLPKVLIVVHMAGLSCDMQRIHQLAQEYNFKIIEDASHAIGGEYQGKKIGNCQYSDMVVFSFHPVKIITTAEGGMVLTNNHQYAQKLAQLRSHGITKDPEQLTANKEQAWYYEQQSLGFNFRMTELQAALGLSQLPRLDVFIEQRQALAKNYLQALKGLPLSFQQQNEQSKSSYHLFLIQLTDESPIDRTTLFNQLRKANIGVNVHYIPIHTQPYYQEIGFNEGDFPQAESYYEQCLSLPLYPDLSKEDFKHIVSTLTDLLSDRK
ncbi:UDP-4-amino-4,6-dideoxy-N-acetyl-beta-L-altrosamine transaminase [Colwelliaceae bacterium 6441]